MAQSKREQYKRTRAHVEELADEGEIDPDDADLLLRWCDAYDPDNATENPPATDDDSNRWGDERKPSTLRQWLTSVSAYARTLDAPLADATADDLNEASQSMFDGDAPTVKDSGLSRNTVSSRQQSLKRFLKYANATDGAAADPAGITTFDKTSTAVDPSDMLTRDEFLELRDAPEHPRDRALLNVLLYTGQRSYAVRTLRVRDVDLDDGTYRLNSDMSEGLKGADLVGRWNPLLGAVGPLKDWRRHHPEWENPDAYLFCERRDSVVRDATEFISDDTVNRVIREASERAAIDEPGIAEKPTKAHALRHNFVTICKRDYDLDDSTIKRLIRHKPDSTVMETTYQHLSDEDYIRRAEEAFGYRDEDESTMTPQTCDTCHEPLPDGAKHCPRCGEKFTPGAPAQVNTDRVVQEVRDDPEAMQELASELAAEMRGMADELDG